MHYKHLKRIIDVFLSFLAILFFSPILLIVSIFLFFINDGNPFFIQKRPGKNQKLFDVIKFRSMNNKKDENGKLLPDSDRLTMIGKLVRSTSLDELPQLYNVLKGDMSIIGPRPLLVQYLPLYTKYQMRRHEVRPGITGWAQVNGRNSISWKQKFDLDVWYVDNMSFLLDLKILYLTIRKVITREGIKSETSSTMEEFKGN